LDIVCLVRDGKKLGIAKKPNVCFKKPLWVHIISTEKTYPKVLRENIGIAENILGKTLILPIPKAGLNIHIVVGRSTVITWGSESSLSHIEKIIKLCVEKKCFNIDAVVEELLFSIVNDMLDELNSLELELDTLEEALAKAYETRNLFSVFKRLRKMRRQAIMLRTFVSRVSSAINIKEAIIEEASSLIEHLEKLHERLMTLVQFNYIVLSDKTNKVVQKLTVISSIFLPLTLIASIYGMNFKYMPELYHPLGYYIILTVMALIALVQIVYFRRKKWI